MTTFAFPLGILKTRLHKASPLTRRFASAAGWSLCAAALSRVMMLAIWVICGRVLVKEEFGALTLIYTTINMLANLGGLGLGVTATRYLGELRYTDPAKAGRLVGMSYVLSLGSGIVMAGALFVAARPVAVHVLGNGTLGHSLQIGALLVLFTAINSHQLGALSGFHAFRQIAVLGFWTGLFALAAVLVGLHYGGLLGAVWALGAWRVLIWLTYHLVLRRECERHGIRIKICQWAEERKLLWQFSVPALLISVVYSPAMWLCSVWLMRTPDGYSQMALFGAADRWHTAILFVPSAMVGAVLPMLSAMLGERNIRGFHKVLYANAAVCFVLVGLPAALFAVAAPLAMRVFGESYVGGASVLRWLCIAAMAEVVNGILGQAIAIKSMWVRFSFDVLLVCLLVLSSYVLIPHWGAAGFAAAYALAFFVVAGGLLIYAGCSGYSPVREASATADVLVNV